MVYDPVKEEEGTETAVGVERNLTGSIKLNQVKTVEGTGSFTKAFTFFFCRQRSSLRMRVMILTYIHLRKYRINYFNINTIILFLLKIDPLPTVPYNFLR